MSLFQEIEYTDLSTATYGVIKSIEAESVAARLTLKPGDRLYAINGNPVQDVIDVQFYAAEEALQLTIQPKDEADLVELDTVRPYGEPLGIEFEHPTFDTDIRRCNNLCEFCFVLQMAPRFRRTLYIKDDDYRYSFLFGHYVTLTNLDDHDWWRIETMGLSPLYVSVHVTDLEKRREFLRNLTAPDILPQLKRLADAGIEIHTQLVVVPEFNDGPWLERSVRELAELWPAVRSISVVPVGLTNHHKYKMRTHTVDEASGTLAYVEALQAIYLEKFGVRFVYPTDEWYLVADQTVPPLSHYDDQALHENGLGMVRNFLDEWNDVKLEIVDWLAGHQAERFLFKSVSLITATLFAETLSRCTEALTTMVALDVEVIPLTNMRLGDKITVAGLLMAEDVIAQLSELGPARLGEVVILPRVMFDHPDTISLDDLTPQAVADRLSRPVALADTMGDVWDVVIGNSKTLVYPDNEDA